MKGRMMSRGKWRACLLTISALLLTGCAGGNTSPPPVVIAPTLYDYSAEFQTRLADELETEPLAPCPRDFPIKECSAWVRAILDYGRVREQIRSVK